MSGRGKHGGTMPRTNGTPADFGGGSNDDRVHDKNTEGNSNRSDTGRNPPTRSFSGRAVMKRGATWREANLRGPPRRMEVSIPHKNLKVFASAIQCLMRVGKDLFIEATSDQLILRTLNDAKSAFAAFYFNDAGGFFETFSCAAVSPGGDVSSTHDGSDTQGSSPPEAGAGSVTCKVLVRAVHSIFRTLKKVVRLVIYIEGEDDAHIEPHLVFQMYCEFGYRKVHRFSLQDCEIMHAVFEPDGASRLSCPPVQLSQLLEHIHGTAEVAVGAAHDVLTVRSYHHPLSGSAERAVLKTEMCISSAEFDTYRFCGADDEEVELVFSLKEIKALLHFTEATEAQTLEMLFKEGGDPLLFQSTSKTFASELIMASMEPKVIRSDAVPAPATATHDRNAVADRGGQRDGSSAAAAAAAAAAVPPAAEQDQERQGAERERQHTRREQGDNAIGRGQRRSHSRELEPARPDVGMEAGRYAWGEDSGQGVGGEGDQERRRRLRQRNTFSQEQGPGNGSRSFSRDEAGDPEGSGVASSSSNGEMMAEPRREGRRARERNVDDDDDGYLRRRRRVRGDTDSDGEGGSGAHHDSELPTQFPGMRAAFDSADEETLSGQAPAAGRRSPVLARDAAAEVSSRAGSLSSDRHRGGDGGGGGESSEEEVERPVHGTTKRRRRIIGSMEEE